MPYLDQIKEISTKSPSWSMKLLKKITWNQLNFSLCPNNVVNLFSSCKITSWHTYSLLTWRLWTFLMCSSNSSIDLNLEMHSLQLYLASSGEDMLYSKRVCDLSISTYVRCVLLLLLLCTMPETWSGVNTWRYSMCNSS
jgi:hypothetical protein